MATARRRSRIHGSKRRGRLGSLLTRLLGVKSLIQLVKPTRIDSFPALRTSDRQQVYSTHNFIRAGYRLFSPKTPWAWPNTLYWRKDVK
jgi:hypothetical protein